MGDCGKMQLLLLFYDDFWYNIYGEMIDINH